MLSYTPSDAIDVGDHTKLLRQDFETRRSKPQEKSNEVTKANGAGALPNSKELMQKNNSLHWFIFHVEGILYICREDLIGLYEWRDY